MKKLSIFSLVVLTQVAFTAYGVTLPTKPIPIIPMTGWTGQEAFTLTKAYLESQHAEQQELTATQASEAIAEESKKKAGKYAEADKACQAKKNHANEVYHANTEKHTATKYAEQKKHLKKKQAIEVQALVGLPFYPYRIGQ